MDLGDLLVEMLIGYGVKYVFGVPGGQTAPLYNAIAERADRIQHILVRDERTGPYAADAYARVAGRLAVCDAVPGPGVVKLPSGLSEAYNSSIPLVAIAGDLPVAWQHLARYGCAAQGLDQLNLLRPVCKAVIPVNTPAALPAAVRQAFREATTGRPGPVVLDIPADVLATEWNPNDLPVSIDCHFSTFPAARVHPPVEAVDDAARLLLSAERPVMVVGGGGLISQAFREVQDLAEALAMPVATTVSGKGIISEEHPLAVGVLGGQYGEECANTVVRDADVVLLVGFKSSQQSTFQWTLPTPAQRVIHLDIDPYEIGKVFRTEVALVADAAAGLSDLLHRIRAEVHGPPERGQWLAQVTERKRQWKAEIEREAEARVPIPPQLIMAELQRQLNPEDLLVSDASFAIGWVTSFYDVRRSGRRCLFPRGSATLGYGLPAALGARLADPNCRVVCLTGDGGISYALGELSTFRKYNLRIVTIVLNNSCLAYSKWGELLGEQHFENVDFPATNFAMVAEGFGCVGFRVEAPDQLSDALAAALESEHPVLLDVVVDEWETPELMLRRYRSQGLPHR